MTYRKTLIPLIISSSLIVCGYSSSYAQSKKLTPNIETASTQCGFFGIEANKTCLATSPNQQPNSHANDLSISTTSTTEILKEARHLKPEVLSLALRAYTNAVKQGVGVNKHLLTVIDYSMPSAKKRMWVIDLNHSHVVMNLLVAHGKNTGWKDAKQFSNTPQSRETSLGLFETEYTYNGHNGYSLRLKGLDQGFNNNAESRAIVVHGAPYVSDAFAKRYNRVGNSWGCPAVDKKYASQLINTIKGGSLLFAYYPDPSYLSHSVYLQA